MSIMNDTTLISWVQIVISALSAWIAWMAYKKMDVDKSRVKAPIEIRLANVGVALAFSGSILSFMGFSGWGMLAILIACVFLSTAIGMRPGPIARIEVLALVWINTALAIGISSYLVIKVLLPNELLLQKIAQ